MLPSLDLTGPVRETAFALLLKDHAPVSVDAIAATANLSPDETRREVQRLAAAGWLDVDPAGSITGSAGLSITSGPHRLELQGVAFRTWCAYDAVGIAGALQADATVVTACGICGGAIEFRLIGGLTDAQSPGLLWVADRGEDLRRDFCTPTVLLCSEVHGEEWRNRHEGRGELVTLAAGTEKGAQQWARCAQAAAHIRSSGPPDHHRMTVSPA